MAQNRNKVVAAVTAAGACALSAPLFVLPGSQGRLPQQQVVTGAHLAQATALSRPSFSSMLPVVGLAAAGAALVAKRSSRAKKAHTASQLRASGNVPPPPFNPAAQVGALAPLGYFDPAGLSKVGDKDGFRNLRAAELKHGRVAMMAALGGVAQHYVKFPGFESVPSGTSAVTTAPGTYGFVALFLLSGALELAIWTQDPSKEPGDFGDPVGFGQYTQDWRNREINNGRFAMFAAIGIIGAELLTGKDAVEQFGL